MDQHAKWARAHLPGAATLSDAELRFIAVQAWRPWRRVVAIAGTLGLLLILTYRDRLVFQLLGPGSQDWLGIVVLILVAAACGAVLGWATQSLVRRQMRRIIETPCC